MSTTISGVASDTLSGRLSAFLDSVMDAAGRIARKVQAGVIAADALLEEHPEFVAELKVLEAIAPPEVRGAVDITSHLLDAVATITTQADSMAKAVANAAPGAVA